MKTSISVDLEVVSEILSRIRAAGEQPLTSGVIKAYMGHFVANTGVPAHLSWNAQFGRILSEHSEALGIRKLSDEAVTDELGNATTSMRWEFV